MNISEVTKRNILDDLKTKGVVWNGRLNEFEFLSRLVNLEELPSHDTRFKNMEQDIWQHRVNNYDWDDWWIIEDTRLDILNNDDLFLNFLCEMIHPVVRNDSQEVASFLKLFNSHLVADGWKLVEKDYISGKPVFAAISDKKIIDFENEGQISQDFVRQQLLKCDNKIDRGDYDGAISSARSLVEGAIDDIYTRIVGEKMEKKGRSGDLMSSYKRIKGLLNLSPEKYSNDSIKGVLGAYITILNSIDSLGNQMGDRHTRISEPMRHHAKLCVNSAKIFCDFLYDTLKYHHQNREILFEGLVSAIDNEKRFWGRKRLMEDPVLKKILAKCDASLRSILKEKFIEEYEVTCFRRSDILFAGLELFFEELSKSDIKKIFDKHRKNSQACGLPAFLKEVETTKPDLVGDTEILDFLKNFESQS